MVTPKLYILAGAIVVVAEGHKSDDALILSEELYLKFKEDL